MPLVSNAFNHLTFPSSREVPAASSQRPAPRSAPSAPLLGAASTAIPFVLLSKWARRMTHQDLHCCGHCLSAGKCSWWSKKRQARQWNKCSSSGRNISGHESPQQPSWPPVLMVLVFFQTVKSYSNFPSLLTDQLIAEASKTCSFSASFQKVYEWCYWFDPTNLPEVLCCFECGCKE